MTTAIESAELRRERVRREERALLTAIAVAADRLVDNVPGATFKTLESTVLVWREWKRRRGARV